MYDYLIRNSRTELKIAIMKLFLHRPGYQFDYRNTVIDLLDLGVSYRSVYQFETLHDDYHEFNKNKKYKGDQL